MDYEKKIGVKNAQHTLRLCTLGYRIYFATNMISYQWMSYELPCVWYNIDWKTNMLMSNEDLLGKKSGDCMMVVKLFYHNVM